MELKRASSFNLTDLTRIWNLGYTDYFVPITFTEALMERHIRTGDLDLDKCVVLMDGEEPVGFSMMGVRGDRGWVGGFGISPAYRGKGLAYQLFKQHVALYPSFGLKHVQLEVMVQNWAAKVYAREGFQTTRRLQILQGQLPEAGSPLPQAAPADLLAHSDRLHAAYPACWQREPAHLAKSLSDAAQAIYTGPIEAPTGFVIFQQAGENLVIWDTVGDSVSAPALAVGLAHLHPGRTVRLLNEHEGSPMALALGLTETGAQYEMHWESHA